jgi:hypothetical protein
LHPGPSALIGQPRVPEHHDMDIIIFWVLAAVLFAALSLLFAPDSRDDRRAIDHYGSWAGLKA